MNINDFLNNLYPLYKVNNSKKSKLHTLLSEHLEEFIYYLLYIKDDLVRKQYYVSFYEYDGVVTQLKTNLYAILLHISNINNDELDVDFVKAELSNIKSNNYYLFNSSKIVTQTIIAKYNIWYMSYK